MARVRDRFINSIVCEDIRIEMGRKRSLMGVFSGNIIVEEMPAQLQLAFYFDYLAPKEAGTQEIRLQIYQDDDRMAEIKGVIDPTKGETGTIVVPRALIVFAKKCDLIVKASVNRGRPIQLIRKSVTQGQIEKR